MVNKMIEEIQIKELSQKETDRLIEQLSGDPLKNFKEGFDVEKEKMRALPLNERTYYLILLKGNPYLFVGINSFINISSFARVVLEPKGKAAVCLNQLITEKLVPICNCLTPRKNVISSRLKRGGYKVFQYLQKNLPKGIEKIIIQESGSYWSCQIHIR